MNIYPVGSPAGACLLGGIPILKRFIAIAEQGRRRIRYLEHCHIDRLLEMHPDFLTTLREQMADSDFLGVGTTSDLSLVAQCVDIDSEHRELSVRLGLRPDPALPLRVGLVTELTYGEVIRLCNHVVRSTGPFDTHLFVTVPHEDGTACCQIFSGDEPLNKVLPYIVLPYKRWLGEPVLRADAL